MVVQAPEHVIERARALAKAGDDPKKRRKVQGKKPADGEVSWTEETFERLRDAAPEALVSRMRVDHSMILNVVNQPGDAVATMRALMEDNHEDERGRQRLSEQAEALRDELLDAGRAGVAAEPDADGRTLRLAPALQEDFALNQPLASFALAALDLLDPESETYALDVVSVVEAILDDPFPVLMAQANKERGEAVAEMKAEGIEYEERMELLEEVTYPKPLAEPLEQALRAVPRDAPVGARVRPLPEVGRARHVRAGPHLHRVRRLLRARALRGPRAALPQRRLPRAAPDGARAASRPRSSTRSSSGSARPSARPTRACSTSGRR